MNHEHEIIHATGNLFDVHLDHCDTCKNDIIHPCDTGRDALRRSVESGHANSFDRELNRQVNGDRDDG